MWDRIDHDLQDLRAELNSNTEKVTFWYIQVAEYATIIQYTCCLCFYVLLKIIIIILLKIIEQDWTNEKVWCIHV